MRAVVVHCHPVQTSFSSALKDAAVRGLRAAGHDVTVLDLADESFRCTMTRDEWDSYMAGTNVIPADISHHVDAVRTAEMLVFVYPTWWSGLPAQMKGWLERVMLPGVAFNMVNDRIRPALGHVRRIVVISTYGSPWIYVKTVNDNGKRTLARALRAATGWRARCRHFGLYAMDTSTEDQRRKFLDRVERGVAR